MVKRIDDKTRNETQDLLPDHVGVDLFRAALAWRDQLHDEMVRRGHAWYGDARAVIAQHLDPRGMSQTALVERVGLTKQAVQQMLDSLAADGIVKREPDPKDGRAKRVSYTRKGIAALRDAAEVKRAIEADYRKRLGAKRFEAFVASLRILTEP